MGKFLFISRTEAADQLGISLPTLNHRILDGSIPHVKLGRRILIPAETLDRLIDKAFSEGGK